MRHNLKTAIVEVFGSQLSCASEVGIHPVRLNRICNGWADPTPEERRRLVSGLNAEPSWLFSETVRIPRPSGSSVAPQPPPPLVLAGQES